MDTDTVSHVNKIRNETIVLQGEMSLDDLERLTDRCRSPKQLRALLDRVQTFLPYQSLVCGWGYRSHPTIGVIFNHGYPVEFLRWYLSKGLLWKGPVFQEWLRTEKAQVYDDVQKRLKDQFDPELRRRARKFNLQHSIAGGLIRKDLWIFFALSMDSAKTCRAHLELFQSIAPMLAKALKRACPRPLLSNRELAVLERRAMGESLKVIAASKGITERTVRFHLQRIKRKLYTDDLVNAVVIAVRSGMLEQTWKEWNWRKETATSR